MLPITLIRNVAQGGSQAISYIDYRAARRHCARPSAYSQTVPTSLPQGKSLMHHLNALGACGSILHAVPLGVKPNRASLGGTPPDSRAGPEPSERIELSASFLPRRCSTTELTRHAGCRTRRPTRCTWPPMYPRTLPFSGREVKRHVYWAYCHLQRAPRRN